MRLPSTLAISVALHAAVVSGLLMRSFWMVEELSLPGRRVRLVSAGHVPPAPAARTPGSSAARRRPRPRPRPAPTDTRMEVPREEHASHDPPVDGVDDDRRVVSSGEDRGEASGVSGGESGAPTAPPPRELSPERRRSLLERYLQEILRSRIAGRFKYPPEAESLGLEGTVIVQIAVDGNGTLVGLGIRGACPHQILCEHATRTLRACAPFPPPPSELVGTIAVDVPLSYTLD